MRSRFRPARNTQLFAQVQVINLFNQFQLCGCGATVFANGGTVTQTRIDQSVLTASTNASQFTAFNPFTTAPVRGANWAPGPNYRHRAEPVCLHDAARNARVVRRPLLIGPRRATPGQSGSSPGSGESGIRPRAVAR